MNQTEHIEINSEKRFGKPIIIGTRISVEDILNLTSEGMSVSEILLDFPELNEDQIKACLIYYMK
jgi:uncharacterized protein (DUF433 family)